MNKQFTDRTCRPLDSGPVGLKYQQFVGGIGRMLT